MPNPGQVNNPGGVNGLYDESEHPYGAIKRLTQLTQEAPLAGGQQAGSEVASAQRAQRQATRPPSPSPPRTVVASPEPPTLPQAPPSVQDVQQNADAATWAALATHPEASPLVQIYAQEATSG